MSEKRKKCQETIIKFYELHWGGIKDSSLPESSKQIKYSHIKQMQASRRTGRPLRC